VRAARIFVAATLQSCGASEDVIDRFRLVLSELAANVVTHGIRPGWTVGIKATRDWFTMDVSGGGASPDNVIFHPDRWTIAGPDQPSGRGLGIVRTLMDDVTADMSRNQVKVVCRVRRGP